MNDFSVSVAKIAQILDLKNFTDNIDLKKIKITSSDVNRPALQLTGYFAHFEQSRIQMIGNVEYAYIQQMSDEEKRIFIRLLECDDPDLFNWLMNHGKPADAQLEQMVRLIQTRNRERGPVAI